MFGILYVRNQTVGFFSSHDDCKYRLSGRQMYGLSGPSDFTSFSIAPAKQIVVVYDRYERNLCQFLRSTIARKSYWPLGGPNGATDRGRSGYTTWVLVFPIFLAPRMPRFSAMSTRSASDFMPILSHHVTTVNL